MLADVRGRDQNLSQGNRVIRQEVESEIVFRVRIGIDYTCNIDDETDCLGIYKLWGVTILVNNCEPVLQCNLNDETSAERMTDHLTTYKQVQLSQQRRQRDC